MDAEFRTLDDGGKLREGNVNAYYIDDLKRRVSVARRCKVVRLRRHL